MYLKHPGPLVPRHRRRRRGPGGVFGAPWTASCPAPTPTTRPRWCIWNTPDRQFPATDARSVAPAMYWEPPRPPVPRHRRRKRGPRSVLEAPWTASSPPPTPETLSQWCVWKTLDRYFPATDAGSVAPVAELKSLAPAACLEHPGPLRRKHNLRGFFEASRTACSPAPTPGTLPQWCI